jgi:hypothetical protein
MLVRALKVLSYFRNETAGTTSATAALDQPGDEGCAYGRARKDWQRQIATPKRARSLSPSMWEVGRRHSEGLTGPAKGRARRLAHGGTEKGSAQGVIRKSGDRFSLATNAKRLRGDHAPGKDETGDLIQTQNPAESD